jgi:hypothetical protein
VKRLFLIYVAAMVLLLISVIFFPKERHFYFGVRGSVETLASYERGALILQRWEHASPPAAGEAAAPRLLHSHLDKVATFESHYFIPLQYTRVIGLPASPPAMGRDELRTYSLDLTTFINVCGAVIAIFSLRRSRREVQRIARAHKGLCIECGYDLCATPEQCPECGHIPSAKVDVAR